jgi:hypothetical protein
MRIFKLCPLCTIINMIKRVVVNTIFLAGGITAGWYYMSSSPPVAIGISAENQKALQSKLSKE